jgi:DNA-binding CsgD family transcriptional regulator
MRSLFAQGEAGLARALDATTDASALRARALWGRAFLLTFAGKLEHSFLTAQQALDAAEELGDESTIARALWLVGIPMMWVDPEASRPGLERARDLAARAGDEFGLLHATQGLGMSYLLQDENHRARPLHEEARRLAERLGQQDALAWHWLAVAIAGWVSGDLGVLDEAARKSQSAARRAGDIVTEAGAIAAMGLGAADSGEPRRMFEELVAVRKRALAKGGGLIFFTLDLALALAHAADGRLEDARAGLERLIGHSAGGWMWMLMRAHTELAEVDRLRGDARLARREAEEGLELAGRIGDRPLAAAAQLVLGRLAAARGEWTEAQRLHHDVLPIAVEYGTPRVPRVLEALAEVAAGLQSHTEAARILGAAERRWTELGLLAWPHQRTEVEALAARVRQALGEEPYEQAFAEGRELTAEEAVAYVRRARGERKRPSAGWESLTPTELEVARYAASGLTNPEIAERMFISPGTVRTHLSHVFVKLGLRNRSELAREMTRRTGAASDD